jgi:hypothetical protein
MAIENLSRHRTGKGRRLCVIRKLSSFRIIPFALGFFLALTIRGTWAADVPGHGMWVYNTAAIASSIQEQERLFSFCRERGIRDLFWQVHFSKTEVPVCILENATAQRSFLRAAHEHKIRVHALTGDPSHTRLPKHARVLALLEALLIFNADSDDGSRFDGLHLDIEPHGLPEWKSADKELRCELLSQFVEMHRVVAERLRREQDPIQLGTDLVFWLNKTDPDGLPEYPVALHGQTKDPMAFILDLVDRVAIMSYRDTTEGRNGIVAIVAPTLSQAGFTKAKVYVGVKMAPIGSAKESYYGRSEAEMWSDLKSVDEAYGTQPSYAGMAFFHYESFQEMAP